MAILLICKVIWRPTPMMQATPKSDNFAVLSCCTGVELIDLGYREIEKKKMKANHGLKSILGMYTDKIMNI